MQKTAHRFQKPSGGSLPAAVLSHEAESWLLDCEIRQHSPETLKNRRNVLAKLSWFLKKQDFAECGLDELRLFFAYMGRGHAAEGGRWGNPHQTRPVSARTVHTYHNHLRTFFRWLVTQGILEASPMERIAVPTSRPDQVQPFTQPQVDALIDAARKSRHPRRDEAIVYFLWDTGVRASELCSLRRCDLDMAGRHCIVLGKGNKRRSVYFGKRATKVLWAYLREQQQDEDAPLFLGDRGRGAGEPLTRSGLFQLIQRLGEAAGGLDAVRCSPHTFRHTFAVSFLRNGGNVFSLQQILGHTNLTMTNRYVALAEGDIQNQHRQFSPADGAKGGRQ